MTPPNDPDTLREAKKAARAAARAVRAALPSAGAGEALAACFLAEFGGLSAGATVAGYWPIGDELDVRPLLGALAARGHACALPVVVRKGEPLLFRRWAPGDAVAPGALGIPEPDAAAPEVRPDLLLVPLLAFDRAGYRLGYGGGFYDRTLERLRRGGPVTAAGVGYAGQEVAAVPRDAYDQPLDWIVTERYALKF